MNDNLLRVPSATMRNPRPVSMDLLSATDVDHKVTTRPVSAASSTMSAPASARGSRCPVNQYKCVVVGDGGVGKTSMLVRFVQGDFFTEYQPTDFDSFTVSMALGDEWMPCTMTLVDTAGQETYDRLRTLTYHDADVFIVCFSVAYPDSYINVRARWIPELREYKPKTPIILVGTQSDLRDKLMQEAATKDKSSPSTLTSSSATSQNSDDQSLSPAFVTRKEGKRLATKVKARMYSECSALTGEGLDKIFYQALMTAVVPKKKRRFWNRMKRLFA
ncbi:cell division control protein 42 homolog [Plakobranchus ocellatus]|uniref:Cell division control protein 42 homolog n=1 Tax=Plakobranchus ocellatus TaxID=259542 RepID=A0AAV4B3L4_9GAST|nr:cell division control protein 42 homolog [Plakobranchus ocellatus]